MRPKTYTISASKNGHSFYDQWTFLEGEESQYEGKNWNDELAIKETEKWKMENPEFKTVRLIIEL